MAEGPQGAGLQGLVESLLEDERLRSDLTDEESRVLLDWGVKQLEAAAPAASPAQRGDSPGAGQQLKATAERVAAAIREINDLVAERATLAPEQLAQRVGRLQAGWQAGTRAAAMSPASADISALRQSQDNVQFIRRLTGMLSGGAGGSGGGGQTGVAGRAGGQGGGRGEGGRSPLLLAGLVALLLLACIVVFLVLRAGRTTQPPAVEATAGAPATRVTLGAPATQAPAPVPTAPAAPSVLTPAAQAWYQVYFTSPKYPDKVADHKGGLDERLTAFINTAHQSVDIAIYQLDLPNVTQALLDAKKRGCVVRAVTDSDILDDPKENPSFKQLQAARIVVVGGNPNAIMHDKFVVVDKQAVWAGSWNFTENDTYRYNNNGILIQSPGLAANYTAAFEKMWQGHRFGSGKKPGGTTYKLNINGTPVENYFAPEDNVAAKILPRLQAAQKTIDFLAFSFTDDALGSAIMARAKAGVKVRGVFETTGSETQYSEYGKMKTAKLDVWQDGNGYLMHHKVFIIDGKTVVFGSFNFSQNADTENDENLLIVDDGGLAAQFAGEFARVYDTAIHPVGKKQPTNGIEP